MRPRPRFVLSALLLLLLLLALGSLACGNSGAARSSKPLVAVSIFPLYDIAKRVAGDRLEVVFALSLALRRR